MKELLMTFVTAALLTVCLCIPAFAADEECTHENWNMCVCLDCGYACTHLFASQDSNYCSICEREVWHEFYEANGVWSCVCGLVCNHDLYYWCPDGYGSHQCAVCLNVYSDCLDDDDDGFCDVCGELKPSLILTVDYINEDTETGTIDLLLDAFDTVTDSTLFSLSVSQSFFDDSLLTVFEHYFSLSESVTWNGVDCLCGDEFSACLSGGASDGCVIRYVNGYPFLYVPGYSRPIPFDMFAGIMTSDNFTLADAGASDSDLLELSDILGVSVSLSDPFSLYLVAQLIASEPDGFLVYDPGSPSVLPSITAFVTSSIDWVSSFVLCIVTNPLFLIFVCCIFVGLGIGLLKRVIHL